MRPHLTFVDLEVEGGASRPQKMLHKVDMRPGYSFHEGVPFAFVDCNVWGKISPDPFSYHKFLPPHPSPLGGNS